MVLNKHVFGYNKFSITDKRLFWGSADYRDTSKIKITAEFREKGANLSKGYTESNWGYYQSCQNIFVSYENTNEKQAGNSSNNLLGGYYYEVCSSWSWGLSGGYNGGGGSPEGGGGGWMTTSNDPTQLVNVQFVTNTINTNFPCLVNAFNTVTEPRLTNCLYQLYVDTYVGENKVHNLEILSGSPLVDQNNNPVESKSRVKPGDPNTYQIALNEDFGTEFTQEYWSSIILHEMVHGFIQKNSLNFTATSQFHSSHQTMLMIWANDIKAALIDSYPNMTEQDALCLAIIGMSDMLTDDVNDTFRHDMTQWMEQFYNVDANLLGSTREAYRNGTKGILCN